MSEAHVEEEQWLPVEVARQQAHDYVLSFLPDEPDEGGDCETCRVIKAIAAGFLAQPEPEPEESE